MLVIVRGFGIAVGLRVQFLEPGLTPFPVGVNNHRQFIIFITTLVIGITLFDYLTWACKYLFDYLQPVFITLLVDFSSIKIAQDPAPACLLPASVCNLAATDMFLFSVAAWATLQLVWTVVLVVWQFYQISRQITTLEAINLGRYGHMGSRGGSHATQMGHRHMPLPHTDSDDALSGESTPTAGRAHGHGHGHSHAHTPRHATGCNKGFLLQLIGFDRFTTGKAANGLAGSGHAANPFSVGVVGNCRDFWTRGRELGVEYDRLYEIPTEGFTEARRRREREEVEEPGVGRKGHGLRQKLLLGLGIGGASARAARGGYEPVSQV